MLPATQPSSWVTVVVTLRLPVAGMYTNKAQASSDTPDQNQANNSMDEPTTVVEAADLALAVTPSATTVAAGQPYSYSVVSSNLGPDALAAAATQSIRFTVPPGSMITAPPLVVPAVSTVAGNVAAVFTVSATKGDGTPMPDADASNNTRAVNISSSAGSDVALTKTVAPAVVEFGQQAVFTLTARHLGGVPPGGSGSGLITVTDTLPAGMGFVSASGTGWTCSFTAPTVICTRPGPLALNTDAPDITVPVRADSAPLSVTNQACLALSGTRPTSASSCADGPVSSTTTRADLSIAKIASGTVEAGKDLVYTLSVHNNGPLASEGAQVIDTLPAGTSFVSGTGCVDTGAAVPCAVGPLAVGASKSFTVSLKLASPYTGARPLVNNASVDAPGDTDPSNNSAQTSTPVGPDAVTEIPTLSQWALILLSLLMAGLAWRRQARR